MASSTLHQRKILQHTRIQKIRRLQWSSAYRNTHKLAVNKAMFTNSMMITLKASVATCSPHRWHAMGTRSTMAAARQSKGVHAYMGATAFGVSNLVFVTGGGTKVSTYRDPKTGSPHKGLRAEEFIKDVLPLLLKVGNMLFKGTRRADSWDPTARQCPSPRRCKDSGLPLARNGREVGGRATSIP